MGGGAAVRHAQEGAAGAAKDTDRGKTSYSICYEYPLSSTYLYVSKSTIVPFQKPITVLWLGNFDAAQSFFLPSNGDAGILTLLKIDTKHAPEKNASTHSKRTRIDFPEASNDTRKAQRYLFSFTKNQILHNKRFFLTLSVNMSVLLLPLYPSAVHVRQSLRKGRP